MLLWANRRFSWRLKIVDWFARLEINDEGLLEGDEARQKDLCWLAISISAAAENGFIFV